MAVSLSIVSSFVLGSIDIFQTFSIKCKKSIIEDFLQTISSSIGISKIALSRVLSEFDKEYLSICFNSFIQIELLKERLKVETIDSI